MLSVCCNPARTLSDFDRIVEGFFAPALGGALPLAGGPAFPAMNLWQSDGALILDAELPGFKPEDIDVTVQHDEVTLRGSRAAFTPPEGARVVRQERAAGSFERTLRLPFTVDSEKVKAEFRNGVLTLSLPKPAEALPRKVRVTTN